MSLRGGGLRRLVRYRAAERVNGKPRAFPRRRRYRESSRRPSREQAERRPRFEARRLPAWSSWGPRPPARSLPRSRASRRRSTRPSPPSSRDSRRRRARPPAPPQGRGRARPKRYDESRASCLSTGGDPYRFRARQPFEFSQAATSRSDENASARKTLPPGPTCRECSNAHPPKGRGRRSYNPFGVRDIPGGRRRCDTESSRPRP